MMFMFIEVVRKKIPFESSSHASATVYSGYSVFLPQKHHDFLTTPAIAVSLKPNHQPNNQLTIYPSSRSLTAGP